MALEIIVITPAIEAREERDVSTIDINVLYLHIENNEYLILVLIGRLTELMDMMDPNLYQKCVTMDKNGQTLI